MTNNATLAREYFPLGKAYSKAFCNRVDETKWLIGNILSGKHSLLIAPRRYGKSSLAEKALKESKLPHIKTNFHLCVTQQEVAELIIQTSTQLIGTAIGPVEKLIKSIKRFLTHLQPKLSLGGELAKLELEYTHSTNLAIVITESLLLLEKLLKEKGQRAVIFFDEFQEIAKLPQSVSIEGAIRTAAQEMHCLSIIFSGSIRSVLSNMFQDENRPLYKLCRKLKLERIGIHDYEKHLNAIAKKYWGNPLAENTLLAIMDTTNRHPYYMNYLCDILWTLNKNLPTSKNVMEAWQNVVAEEWGDAVRELASLPLNQRKILKTLCNNQHKTLQSKAMVMELDMPASTISSSITTLMDRDYIEKDHQGNYQIVSPLLKAVIDYPKYSN